MRPMGPRHAMGPMEPRLAPLPLDIRHGRELANLTKMYTDESKYSGGNDSFTYKLTIFHDICARADVPHQAKLKALLTMLKGLALDYYYSNISADNVPITFEEVCYSIKEYLRVRNIRGILSRWNKISLKSIIDKTENVG